MLSDGPQTFGRPCRVTAVVYPGVDLIYLRLSAVLCAADKVLPAPREEK